MQAVQQPNKVAVPPNDFVSPPHACDFIVSVLEKEHALFFLEHVDSNQLFHTTDCLIGPQCFGELFIAITSWSTESTLTSLFSTRCRVEAVSSCARITTPTTFACAGSV